MESAGRLAGYESGGQRRRLPRRLPTWGLMFVLLVGVGLAILALYLFSPDWFNLERSLPVGLRSSLLANYAADPFALAQPPVNANIIAEALVDQIDAGGVGIVGQLATLIAPLSSPVPSITPALDGTSAIQPTPIATSGPQRGTATQTQPAANLPTATLMATRTVTTTATLATSTQIRPTNTPVVYQPSPTSGTILTPTQIQRSATPAATTAATAIPQATATHAPPTQPPPPPIPTEPAYPPPATQEPQPTPYP